MFGVHLSGNHVSHVSAGSKAAIKGKPRVGDVLLGVDGISLDLSKVATTEFNLQELVNAGAKGSTVSLTLMDASSREIYEVHFPTEDRATNKQIQREVDELLSRLSPVSPAIEKKRKPISSPIQPFISSPIQLVSSSPIQQQQQQQHNDVKRVEWERKMEEQRELEAAERRELERKVVVLLEEKQKSSAEIGQLRELLDVQKSQMHNLEISLQDEIKYRQDVERDLVATLAEGKAVQQEAQKLETIMTSEIKKLEARVSPQKLLAAPKKPIIYYSLLSAPSRAVLLFCKMAGIEIDAKDIDITKGENKTEEFSLLNPNQHVPVMDDNGFIVFESQTIMRYLAERHEKYEWYPLDLIPRTLVNMYCDWHHTKLRRAAFSFVFNAELYAFFDKESNMVAVQHGAALVNVCLRLINDYFLKQSVFISGNEHPSIADISCFAELHQFLKYSSILDLSPFPKIQDWLQRLDNFNHPAVLEFSLNSAIEQFKAKAAK